MGGRSVSFVAWRWYSRTFHLPVSWFSLPEIDLCCCSDLASASLSLDSVRLSDDQGTRHLHDRLKQMELCLPVPSSGTLGPPAGVPVPAALLQQSSTSSCTMVGGPTVLPSASALVSMSWSLSPSNFWCIGISQLGTFLCFTCGFSHASTHPIGFSTQVVMDFLLCHCSSFCHRYGHD